MSKSNRINPVTRTTSTDGSARLKEPRPVRKSDKDGGSDAYSEDGPEYPEGPDPKKKFGYFSRKSAIDTVADGREASFAGKESVAWDLFFTNIKKRGSRQERKTLCSDEIGKVIFRGVSGLTLLADIEMSLQGRKRLFKFVRCEPVASALICELASLTPGDVLDHKMLDRLGDEAGLVLLRHATHQLTAKEREKQGEKLLNRLKSRFPWNKEG